MDRADAKTGALFSAPQAAIKVKSAGSFPALFLFKKDNERVLSIQSELKLVSVETLVPKDHLLRRIDQIIDFSFIYEKVRLLYCVDNGRPPIDPMMLFKMLFVGYLSGSVPSEGWNGRLKSIRHTAGSWVLG